jgi:CRP-like cAMP-binding protein
MGLCSNVFFGLNLDHYPRLDFGVGDIVLRDGDKTDRLLIVLKGRVAEVGTGFALGPGDVAKTIEFFGSSQYSGQLRGDISGQIALLPRAAVRDGLTAQNAMTWNLACAIAIEVLSSIKENA